MCTVILLRRPGHAWPALIAANRDEMLGRAWDGPAAHWPGHPGIIGGRDRTAGGSWMVLNAAGVLATVLNRSASLGPAPDKRSRGELPLLAAAQDSAAAAATTLSALAADEWRPFNMLLADRETAWFIRSLGHGRPEAVPLGEGLFMVTAYDPNDLASPRTARHLPRFQAAPPPDPDQGDWAGWPALLADSGHEQGRVETLNVPPLNGFGTVSSSLLALADDGRRIWHFAPGPPHLQEFRPVLL